MAYTVKFVAKDEFGIFPGSGWAIFKRGKRIDWPMLATEAEAKADLRGFRKMECELASDEASEIRGLRYMGAL